MGTTRCLCCTIAFLGIFLAACGYRFAGPGQLPGSAVSIHVAIMNNPTAEAGIEVVLVEEMSEMDEVMASFISEMPG